MTTIDVLEQVEDIKEKVLDNTYGKQSVIHELDILKDNIMEVEKRRTIQIVKLTEKCQELSKGNR